MLLGVTLSIEMKNTMSIDVPEGLKNQFSQEVSVNELSGLKYLYDNPQLPSELTQTPNFLVVSDESGHIFGLSVNVDEEGQIMDAKITGALRVPDPDVNLDHEGIAYTDKNRATVFISHERGTGASTPGIHEYALNEGMRRVSVVDVPEQFTRNPSLTDPSNPNARTNKGFESLRLVRATEPVEMWTANEEALRDDGTLATPDSGSLVRLLKMGLVGDSVTPGPQYAYQVDAIHAEGSLVSPRSGLVDMVGLPDGQVITLERSLCGFNCGPGNGVFLTKIFQLDFENATDVNGSSGLSQEPLFTPVAKKVLFSGFVGGNVGMNLEGLALGPRLGTDAQGRARYSLLGVVDSGGSSDVFSDNSIVGFELTMGSSPLISRDTNGTLKIEYYGILRWADRPQGPCMEVMNPSSPHTVVPSGRAKFYTSTPME